MEERRVAEKEEEECFAWCFSSWTANYSTGFLLLRDECGLPLLEVGCAKRVCGFAGGILALWLLVLMLMLMMRVMQLLLPPLAATGSGRSVQRHSALWSACAS